MNYLGQDNWRASGPPIYTQFWYEKYRSGTTQYYRMQIRMWLDAGSWYNDRIRGVHYLDGNQVYNDLIKGNTTSTQKGWDVTIVTPWFSVYNKISGTTAYAVQIYDDNTGGGSRTFYFNLAIDSATPILSIYEVSRTYNSITLGYNSLGPTAPTSIQANNGSNVLGTYYTNPFTIQNLSPKTSYGDLKAYGYSAAGWGGASNSLAITTYPMTVSVLTPAITNITPFGASLSMSSSSVGDTYSSEYSIYDSTGSTLIKGPFVGMPPEWMKAISDLNPETQYQAKFRVRTSGSLLWSNYSVVNFTTITDQAQGWIKAGSSWVKGKVYVKDGGTWVPAKKAYIKVNGAWVETTNN